MIKNTFVTALITTLFLNACQQNTSTPQNQPDISTLCAQATMPTQIRETIQAIINQNTQYFISQDNRNWIDNDKILALTTKLNIHITPPQLNNTFCQTEVQINIPADALQLATTNAPLIQRETPINFINRNIQGSNIQFNQNTFTFPLEYTIQNNTPHGFHTANNQLTQVAQILSNALLAYGIKNTIVFNGQTMSKEQALNQLLNPLPTHSTASTPTILDETLETNTTAPASTPAAEALTPEEPKNIITPKELEQARQNNQIADQNIKSAWQNIAIEIQQDLTEEQKNWENQKQQTCQQVSEQGHDLNEKQYLQIQCDTRLTRERIQYLKGFSIE